MGLSSGFVVPMGGDLVALATLGCLPSSGLSEMVSGLGLVGGGDFADSGSAFLLGASKTSGFSDDIDSLELCGAGSSSILVSADHLLGTVSSLKFEVSSLVVGVASFSEICKDSWVRVLVGLELRLAGFAFVGGVIDLVLPVSERRSLDSGRFSRAGPKGVSLVGEEGLLRSPGFGLSMPGPASALVL